MFSRFLLWPQTDLESHLPLGVDSVMMNGVYSFITSGVNSLIVAPSWRARRPLITTRSRTMTTAAHKPPLIRTNVSSHISEMGSQGSSVRTVVRVSSAAYGRVAMSVRRWVGVQRRRLWALPSSRAACRSFRRRGDQGRLRSSSFWSRLPAERQEKSSRCFYSRSAAHVYRGGKCRHSNLQLDLQFFFKRSKSGGFFITTKRGALRE